MDHRFADTMQFLWNDIFIFNLSSLYQFMLSILKNIGSIIKSIKLIFFHYTIKLKAINSEYKGNINKYAISGYLLG